MPTSSPPLRRSWAQSNLRRSLHAKSPSARVKESLDTFLASEAADTAAARAAILAAAERTEIATVTPVTAKRKTGTSGTPSAPSAARPQP